jgi:hypothetical protein
MHSRWYSVAVVLLWLTTMSWLVIVKVWPSLAVGDPPDYQTILAVQRDSPPVGWQMFWNDQKKGDQKNLGWAVTSTLSLPNGLTEVRSRVHFRDRPLHEIIPEWLEGILKPPESGGAGLQMDACSTLTFDPLQRLSQFESVIQFMPNVEAIKLRGRIEGAKLLLSVHCGELPPLETEVPAPRNSLVNDGLSPLGYLPGLRDGKRWTVEAYGPLRPPDSPKEIIQAAVEARVPTAWNGRVVDTWVVVYRSDPGSALGSAGNPCGKLWVRTDAAGTVLKQEVNVVRSALTFVRTSDEEAARLAERASSDR